LKGCIIKFFDKNLSERLFKIGNNSEQHGIGDEVFRGIASILTKFFRVTSKNTLSIITSHILFALGVPAHMCARAFKVPRSNDVIIERMC
jgi:hypothetical protein